MDTLLAILGWSAFALAILVGLGLDLVGLFGNWIILAALGVLWAISGFACFPWWALVLMVGLATLGEVLEQVFAGIGARRFGGSKGSVVAAVVGVILGGIAGTPWFPLVGTLIGACVGAFAAAALYEYIREEREFGQAMWTGIGASLGKVAGLLAKLFCGLGILVAALFTYAG